MSSTTFRKVLTAGACAAVLGAGLVGCSTSTSSGSKNVLTVGTNGGAPMKAIVAAFEKEHPDVTVEIRDSPENYLQVTGTQLTGGTAPDILQVFPGNGNNVSPIIAGGRGYFADLSAEAWASEVPESTKPLLSTSDGKLVAVPMTFSSIGVVYNQGQLDKLGLKQPSTWSEVIQFCSDARAAGKVPFGLGLSDAWTTQLIPYALTASLVYGQDRDFVKKQTEGSVSFSDSGWRTALDKYFEMEKNECFNDSPAGTPYSAVQDAIRKGDTLATVTVAAESNTIKETGPKDLQVSYAAFPATDIKDENFLSATTGPSFAVNSKSKNADLAKQFMAWLASPETQIAYANAYGDTAAMPGDLKQDSPVAALVNEYASTEKYSTWPDQLWPSTTVQPAMFAGIQGMFSGQDTPESVLKKMDAAYKDQPTAAK